METAPHSYSLVGIGDTLIVSWTVSRSVGLRPQRKGKVLSGEVKFLLLTLSQHCTGWLCCSCSAISQEFPFGRVQLVDMMRKVSDNLIRSIFWVDFSLLICPQWRCSWSPPVLWLLILQHSKGTNRLCFSHIQVNYNLSRNRNTGIFKFTSLSLKPLQRQVHSSFSHLSVEQENTLSRLKDGFCCRFTLQKYTQG